MIYKTIYLKDIDDNFQDSEAYFSMFLYENFGEYDSHFLRPAMVVVPGGGYEFVASREQEPIAIAFMAQGFNCFTVSYSINKKYPQPHLELARVIQYISEHEKEFGLIPNCISLTGGSAGGHLVGSYAFVYPELAQMLHYPEEKMRPFTVCLNYPVLSMNFETHEGTRNIISGKDHSLANKLDVIDHVTNEYPPTYIWHTRNDDCVPVSNTLRMIEKLKENHVLYESLLIDEGVHGLALANFETIKGKRRLQTPGEEEASHWISNAALFIIKQIFDKNMIDEENYIR